MPKPLAVDELVELAVGLARAVAGMHRRGVMHRDITPANIVISRDGAPCLVDFALATSLAEMRPEFTHHSEIVGTLAYLAPEQTGRTGRSVDQRADLYALGATLYELATGDAAVRLRRSVAAGPRPPGAGAGAAGAGEPGRPGAVVRRSSCTCWRRSRTTGTRARRAWSTTWSGCGTPRPAPAALRCGSASGTSRCGCCRRRGWWAATTRWRRCGRRSRTRWPGRCRGVLVGGAPGVGKTALVDELRPVVTGGDGWFVAGKFDQYRRDLEFDAVHQAFRALGRLLLAEPEDELAEVRGRILAAVGRERRSAGRGSAGIRGAAGGAA